MIRLGLIVAQFNRSVTESMEQQAIDAAEQHNVEVAEIIHIPGAYDSPLAADRLARRDDIDAVAVLGAIVTGDTDHDQVIGTATTQSLTEVSLDRDTPVLLGITGPGMSGAEARERISIGERTIEDAAQFVRELREIQNEERNG